MKKHSMRIPVLIAGGLLVAYIVYTLVQVRVDSFVDINEIRVDACNTCCRSNGPDTCDPNNKCGDCLIGSKKA